jgi:hypothetical protein
MKNKRLIFFCIGIGIMAFLYLSKSDNRFNSMVYDFLLIMNKGKAESGASPFVMFIDCLFSIMVANLLYLLLKKNNLNG